VSRSAKVASRGSAACLSCGAGLNFSAMLGLHVQTTHWQSGRSPTSESERHHSCLMKASSEPANLSPPMPGTGHRLGEFLCRVIDIAQAAAATSDRLCRSMRLHPLRQPEFAVLQR
jgi:hypothetical protein